MAVLLSVRCWLYDVSELFDAETFALAMSCLPWQERRIHIGEYRFLKDRCLSLGAGLLVASALYQAGATKLQMSRGTYGKPYLTYHPHIHFNLSHSAHFALCAVSTEPVGVDVEACHEYEAAFTKRVLSDSERSWISTQINADRAFTRIWVRKESYLKLRGTGISDDLTKLTLAPHSDINSVYARDTRTQPSVSDAFFWEYELDECLISVCSHHDMQVSFACAPPGFWRRADYEALTP